MIEQAAETYSVLKQRTADLRRALRRESSFNAITTAIRESLDYQNMLHTIVETIGITFEASCCMLHPVEGDRIRSQSAMYCAEEVMMGDCERDRSSEQVQNVFRDRSRLNSENPPHLVVPLTYQQELLAILSLHRSIGTPVWSVEEIDLIEIVTEQAALAISQARLYRRTTQQAEQIRAELAVARQIQTNLLRQTLPILENLKVQACCQPAREVGGDFFEVYHHPQGELWLAVGDVSGKGVPAALFMASAISVLRRELSQETPPEPDQVMRNLNSILSEDLMGTNCFITMVLARYTPTTNHLVYANAGHIYPLVWSKQTIALNCEPTYLKVRGVPLGILPDWKAIAGNLTLNDGEIFLLTSDGITEATVQSEGGLSRSIDSAGAMLRQTGLWKLLQQAGECLDLKLLLAQIQAHNAIQEDDQTILSLEVL